MIKNFSRQGQRNIHQGQSGCLAACLSVRFGSCDVPRHFAALCFHTFWFERWDGCSRLSPGHSTLPQMLCHVRLLLTGKTGASPGVRALKANIILHFKWQSRMPSHPCQNHSRVTSLTLILLSLHAGELHWVMDDD